VGQEPDVSLGQKLPEQKVSDQKEQEGAARKGPGAAWPGDPLLWPLAATEMAVNACLWWIDRSVRAPERGEAPELPWTTSNRIAADLTTMRLRDFSCGQSGRPALICAPYALHRALIADLAAGHSIIEALQRGGVERLYLTDWRSAAADMRLLSIDHYLADLNVAIDDIGPPVDLIGLCQGGWMALLYAARFPEKVRRLVLVGTPVDLSKESQLSRMVADAVPGSFEALVASGGGLVRGGDLLHLWHRPPDVEVVLQQELPPGDAEAEALRDRFARWNAETLDLPGAFYLDVVDRIFRKNRLAKGSFVALGREVDLSQLKTPLFVLAGEDDEIVPREQATATALLLGTPLHAIETVVAPSTHLGLFIGRETIAAAWPRVAGWLLKASFRKPPSGNGRSGKSRRKQSA
jgi:poly(3-hydroxyalkanoate) synthetase